MERLHFVIGDGAKLDTAFPIKGQAQVTHDGAGEVVARTDVLQLHGTGPVVNHKLQQKPPGKFRDGIFSAAEDGIGAGTVDTLQIVKELGRGDAANDAEAKSAG
jgi:hypothetical protein